MGERRSFTVVASSSEQTGGLYIALTPYNAARKAAKVLLRNAGDDKQKQLRITFRLREKTRSVAAQGHTFDYTATRTPSTRKVVTFPSSTKPGHVTKVRPKWDIVVQALEQGEDWGPAPNHSLSAAPSGRS